MAKNVDDAGRPAEEGEVENRDSSRHCLLFQKNPVSEGSTC